MRREKKKKTWKQKGTWAVCGMGKQIKCEFEYSLAYLKEIPIIFSIP